MDISSESGGISSDKLIDYFTNQFLRDLQKMVAAKEELAKRQGAIAAVDQTLALKAEAAEALDKARAQADSLLAEAKETNASAKEANAAAKTRQSKLDAEEKAFAAASAVRQAEMDARDKVLANKEAYLVKLDADLNKRGDALANAEAALSTRVKAFQAKVAAISA